MTLLIRYFYKILKRDTVKMFDKYFKHTLCSTVLNFKFNFVLITNIKLSDSILFICQLQKCCFDLTLRKRSKSKRNLIADKSEINENE